MSKQITLSNIRETTEYVERINRAAEITIARIKDSPLDGIELLEGLKFEEFGADPLDSNRTLNVIEQINQTFTYLASFRAAEFLFRKFPETKMLHLNLGTTSGFDIESDDHKIVCEVFAATRPSSNNKLNKDTSRLKGISAVNKYVFFLCPGIKAGEYNGGKYGDVIAWSLGFETVSQF
ncbi:MAG: hypothetical protein ACJAR0_003580 [Candidatus Azotimanducaceae bacterium]|jgi:hypothetical protein